MQNGGALTLWDASPASAADKMYGQVQDGMALTRWDAMLVKADGRDEADLREG